MSRVDRLILLWERRLLRLGRTDRADYIVHNLILLRRRKAEQERAEARHE